MNAIAVKGLDFTYGSVQVLNQIHLLFQKAGCLSCWDKTEQEKALF